MTTYISMLRGINVSGHKKVNMDELKALYEALNFKDVKTYIQSGNVVFTSEDFAPDDLSERIEQKLWDRYGFDVPVIIRTIDEMKAILAGNAFLEKGGVETDQLYVTFLDHEPAQDQVTNVGQLTFEPDQFTIQRKEVYVICPNGYGRTKLTNTFFENKLKVKATTRNWKTVNKLVKMADGKGTL